MYSGSKSSETVASGPNIRTPLLIKACFWSSKPLKEAVFTVALATPLEISTILMEPSGSTV